MVLSTNIAESSVTIPDVVYVIDTGKHKEKTYDAENRIACLLAAVMLIVNLMIWQHGLEWLIEHDHLLPSAH